MKSNFEVRIKGGEWWSASRRSPHSFRRKLLLGGLRLWVLFNIERDERELEEQRGKRRKMLEYQICKAVRILCPNSHATTRCWNIITPTCDGKPQFNLHSLPFSLIGCWFILEHSTFGCSINTNKHLRLCICFQN